MGVPIEGLELICIELLPQKSKSIFLLGWYRLPSDPITTFDKLDTVLSLLDNERKEIVLEKSAGTTKLHYSTKKRYHVLGILKSLFSSDTRQSMTRRIATER